MPSDPHATSSQVMKFFPPAQLQLGASLSHIKAVHLLALRCYLIPVKHDYRAQAKKEREIEKKKFLYYRSWGL